MADKQWHDCQADACKSFADKYDIPEYAAMCAIHKSIGELEDQLAKLTDGANKKLHIAFEKERLLKLQVRGH